MRLLILFFIAAFATLLSSCDPCRNLDCVTSNFDGSFRIITAGTGTDLVFGPAKIYDKNLVKFYSLKGTDTTYFDYQPIKLSGTGYDSILQVRFFPQTDTAFMRLSNGDIDTLAITYKTTQTECCGTITEIRNFRYNNAFDIPGGQGTQELKK
ncbi:MAG: hypothetical protein V4717_09220 [Bacteroidota bacterium]